ncbi:hypothetical protein ACFUOZ_20605 [Paenarthrobacter sp. NPDC057355]|uniref:hypothetical protein n=1 Tax=Paenarthrobacter sp. NPDC057355 TaxID=3346105 RepID=UPI0036356A76
MTVTAAFRANKECADPEPREPGARAGIRRGLQLPAQPSPDAWNPVRFAPETD